RELVFQPFYRSLGTNVDGSGLGLPIVLEIARQHGADIRVEDAHPGHNPPGARLLVRVGVTAAPAGAAEAAQAAQAA
ncbi:MAG TPA: ATP-binding protein, partial [Ramlibacter sp.]